MKRILLLVMSLFLFFAITGCSSSDEGSSSNGGEKKTSYAVNETITFEDVNYTITDVKYSQGKDYDKPDKGKEFVIVTIKIENNSDKQVSYNVYDWKMVNSQGQVDDTTFTMINQDDNLSSGELISGGSITGTVVFAEPKDDSSLKLMYYSNIFDDSATFEVVIK